jgi:hypothetical protein
MHRAHSWTYLSFSCRAGAASVKIKEITMEVIFIWVGVGLGVAAVSAAIRHFRQVNWAPGGDRGSQASADEMDA